MAILLSFHKKESKILVSGDDSICFFMCLWKFELKPQNGRFSSFCLTIQAFRKAQFCHLLKCCHFSLVFCLLLLFFCIEFSLTQFQLSTKQCTRFTSSWQFSTLPVTNSGLNLSALKFVTKKKNISAHARHSDIKNN